MLLLIGLALADGPTKLPPDAERGETLYRESCWQCHGANALGDGPLSAALPSPPLAGRIAEDGFPASVDLIQSGKGNMPAFSEVLNRHDTRRILVWLATLDPETGIDPSAPVPEPEVEEADGPPSVEGVPRKPPRRVIPEPDAGEDAEGDEDAEDAEEE
jgi:mono/diheme cytochrome c family protein